MTNPAVTDHSILVNISTSLARLESKVDALVQRIDNLDRRLEDFESRLRVVEQVDVVTRDQLHARDMEERTARRWLIGLLAASTLTIIAGLVNIYF